MIARIGFDPRDWRVKTLLPVILIHAAAFGVLASVTYLVVAGELRAAHQRGARRLLDEVQFDLEASSGVAPPITLLQQVRDRHAGVGIAIFDTTARQVAAAGPAGDEAAARLALEFSTPETVWSFAPNRADVLVAGRRWRSGVLQVVDDLGDEYAAARRRVAIATGIIVLVWMVLAVGTTRIRRRVLGRPLARIERTAAALGGAGNPGPEGPRDLDALADRLHEAIWGLIRQREERETHLRGHMARAEQLATLGELAAGLTHEIKSPLAGVSAALEVARDDEKSTDPARAELFEQMRTEIARVLGTVDGLLRLARPDTPHRAPTDLVELSRHVVDLFRPRARKKRVRVELTADPGLPLLSLDRNLVVQVLLNLLTNALQALPEGGRIRVLVTPFPRNDGAILAIEDDGPGIPAERLESIWEPFYTTKEEGTGLGLPITRTIVEQHGGTITVESTPGRGTKFAILLPIVPAASDS